MYYECNKILSYNRIFNFVIGNRGCGKSYTFKRKAIRNFLKDGTQFIYVRRYEKDLMKTAPTYFDDMVFEFPDLQFEFKLGKFWINGEEAGYPIAVSQFTKMKSSTYPRVKMIIFDEFISESNDYIGGRDNIEMEPELCLSFFQTVARGYNTPVREDVRFIFIANSVSVNNPYFQYFGIDKMLKKDTKILKTKSFVVEQVLNTDIKDAIESSQFGYLIKGTKYGSYAVDNEYYLDNNNFIEEMPKNVYYITTLISNDEKFGLWSDYNGGFYMVNNYVDGGFEYALDNDSHNVNSLQHNSKIDNTLRDAFNNGKVRFQNQRIKSRMLSYMGYL